MAASLLQRLPADSSHKIKEKYWSTEGSGDSVRDPMLLWMVKPPRSRERRQCVVDVMREVAFVTKQRFIWIRAIDHETTRTRSSCGRPLIVPTHPHVTVFTSRDRWHYEYEGHAYVEYDEAGNMMGLSRRSELNHLYRGPNPELYLYGRNVLKAFPRLAASVPE